jgi:ABC-type Zn2+ transport system substrate-binding protein/surface adhesin
MELLIQNVDDVTRLAMYDAQDSDTDEEDEDEDEWEDDHLALQLNWGNCANDGRHEKTSDADWALFCEVIAEESYTKNMYDRLTQRLTERDGVAREKTV